jgi:hypothetical protein
MIDELAAHLRSPKGPLITVEEECDALPLPAFPHAPMARADANANADADVKSSAPSACASAGVGARETLSELVPRMMKCALANSLSAVCPKERFSPHRIRRTDGPEREADEAIPCAANEPDHALYRKGHLYHKKGLSIVVDIVHGAGAAPDEAELKLAPAPAAS